MALIPQQALTPPAEQPLAHAARRSQAVPFNGLTICCDVSGSMAELMPDGKTRWQSLQGMLQDVWTIGSRIISYSSTAKDCITPASLPPQGGGTHLKLALEQALRLPPRQIIIISDGADGDETGALRVASRITCNISALYVGEEGNERATGFLRKLCESHNGTVAVHDLRKLISGHTGRAVMTGAIRGLLEHRP